MRLRHLGLTASLIALALPLAAQKASKKAFDTKQLLGSWQTAEPNGDKWVLQFETGGTAQFIRNGEPMLPTGPQGPTMRYIVDADHSPLWLDLVLLAPTKEELGRMKFLIKLRGPQELLFQSGPEPTIRPERMEEPGASPQIMVFHKAQ